MLPSLLLSAARPAVAHVGKITRSTEPASGYAEILGTGGFELGVDGVSVRQVVQPPDRTLHKAGPMSAACRPLLDPADPRTKERYGR